MNDNEKEEKETLDDVEDTNIIAEFWEFLCENKKFWLIPILLFLLFIAFIIIFGSSTLAPFIYPLF